MSLFPALQRREVFTVNAAPSGTKLDLGIVPGGFVIDEVELNHTALGAGVTLKLTQAVITDGVEGSETDVIAATSASSAGTIVGAHNSTNIRPRRLRVVTGGATTASSNETINAWIKGYWEGR